MVRISSISRSTRAVTCSGDLDVLLAKRERREYQTSQKDEYVLSAWAPIPPYIPRLKPGLAPHLPNLSAGDALIIAVIPLPDILCDLHLSICLDFLFRQRCCFLPRQPLSAADFEKFEGALGAATGRDVSAVTCKIDCKGRGGEERRGEGNTNICARFRGTINRSSPTSARPVAMILFSPFSVRGSSVVPVCRPFKDHSVSP